MRRLWAKIAALIALVLAASPAPAPPPPPPPPDPTLEEPIDGYSPQTLYAIWHFYVEGKKGEAITQLLVSKDDQPGVRFYRPIATFERTGDLGLFLAGRFEAHCKLDEQYRSEAGSCITVFRKASIRAGYYSAGDDGSLSRWTRQAFDARALVRHLRSLGLPPETDWWRQDRNRMFSVLPSPIPMLVERGIVDVLTEAQCPTMAAALAAIDGRQVPITADLPGVGGDDGKTWFPTPHAVLATDYIFLRDGAGSTTIEQSGDNSLLRPALMAADTCLQDRQAD